MTVYRLTKGKYRADLSGKGAEMFGGRWNSKGVALLYTSQSRALSFAEVAMHIPIGITPKDYFLITISFPDTAEVLKLDAADMPPNWRSNPHPGSTQQIGDEFVSDGKYLALQVPSAVVPGDFNYLLNPSHPLSNTVVVENVDPFEFDSRFATKGN